MASASPSTGWNGPGKTLSSPPASPESGYAASPVPHLGRGRRTRGCGGRCPKGSGAGVLPPHPGTNAPVSPEVEG